MKSVITKHSLVIELVGLVSGVLMVLFKEYVPSLEPTTPAWALTFIVCMTIIGLSAEYGVMMSLGGIFLMAIGILVAASNQFPGGLGALLFILGVVSWMWAVVRGMNVGSRYREASRQSVK